MSEQETTAAPEAPVAPSVTVNDLVNIYNIIDLASKRGAFQANELSSVGAVANKVKEFVDHVQAAQTAAAEAAGDVESGQNADVKSEEGA
ncbi:MAG: hypothetical protein HOK61_12520 [Alphaproteobacteria bacterium]|jgi:hypothetical protein|nr:hypothetical protein [Alphaproteobacteria bacterium]